MKLRIDVDDRAVKAALDEFAKRVSNLQPAMQQAGLYMERETKLNFARESDPDGKPWAALKAATLKRKRSTAILRETSTLAGGIALTSTTNTRATVAATAGGEYGIFHAKGTRKMAARQFIGIGDRHVPRIRKIFENHLKL
ncbi:MAG TPA: phage virion morphogenesis protein [Chroococcidiopsis sp.]